MHIDLKYGNNPQQGHAEFSSDCLTVLNGRPGYINLMDALLAWQLVRELKEATGKESAASFKHLSPAGAAVARDLPEDFVRSQFITAASPSPVAQAYLRARGGDRLCSFGDAAAVSGTVDVSLANILKGEVSDLIIAPAYDSEALEILKSKKGGQYLVLAMDPDYEPPALERRELFGCTLVQDRNSASITPETFADVHLSPEQVESLVVATIALKYTQSNSVSVAYDGQLIGVGAGQQSRVHCTRLACDKAEKWLLQQHPRVLGMKFKKGLRRQERVNGIDQYLLWNSLSRPEQENLSSKLDSIPDPLTAQERMDFIRSFKDLCLSSDAYFPFRDSIDRAVNSNIRLIAHPGGSIRDEDVRDAAEEQGVRLIETGLRLFLH